MKGKEKRLGNQQVLVATVELPQGDLRVVCVHLDAHSSKRHRRDQMREILRFLNTLPTLPTFRKANPAAAPILILALTSKTVAPSAM